MASKNTHTWLFPYFHLKGCKYNWLVQMMWGEELWLEIVRRLSSRRRALLYYNDKKVQSLCHWNRLVSLKAMDVLRTVSASMQSFASTTCMVNKNCLTMQVHKCRYMGVWVIMATVIVTEQATRMWLLMIPSWAVQGQPAQELEESSPDMTLDLETHSTEPINSQTHANTSTLTTPWLWNGGGMVWSQEQINVNNPHSVVYFQAPGNI